VTHGAYYNPPNIGSPTLWASFLAGVLLLLTVDLYISGRHKAQSGFKEALSWSFFWIALSIGFGGFVWFRYGGEQGLEFFAGYLLEKSLSVDNLFIFVLLFRSFAVAPEYQHRVLFWGVLGALILRGSLIVAGVALVHRFHWILSIFGAVLIYSAYKILFAEDAEQRLPTDNPLVRFLRRHFPITAAIEGPHFFLRKEGRLFGTPLLLALVAAETADLVFALDSIPAVFAVTDDPFLVFSSNVCALLGLRALYFVVRGALDRLRFLKPGLAAILTFVGLKMLLFRWINLPTGTSLSIIGLILGVVVIASWLRPAHD
jgi:TerC family integral membrane protein